MHKINKLYDYANRRNDIIREQLEKEFPSLQECLSENATTKF